MVKKRGPRLYSRNTTALENGEISQFETILAPFDPNFRPDSGAQVKYRKNTEKNHGKIQRNTEKIQKNKLKYRIFYPR